MSEQLQKALAEDKRAQKRFNVAKNMFFVYLLVVTLFSAVQSVIISQQVRDSLEVNRANGAANHQRTQEYVKCIAITLLKPVQQRSTVDFENCTKNEENKSSSMVNPNDNKTGQQNSIGSTTTPTQQAPQIVIREKNPDEATGAAPPDPKTPTPGQPDPAENSRVLTILDDLLREVDESRVGGTLNGLGL